MHIQRSVSPFCHNQPAASSALLHYFVLTVLYCLYYLLSTTVRLHNCALWCHCVRSLSVLLTCLIISHRCSLQDAAEICVFMFLLSLSACWPCHYVLLYAYSTFNCVEVLYLLLTAHSRLRHAVLFLEAFHYQLITYRVV